ncbi:hypothetical protein QJS66_01680 [Kocuria rhizophila]|nr:hypothetical protein QJS66_01680 [Kocuria rhizophila]
MTSGSALTASRLRRDLCLRIYTEIAPYLDLVDRHLEARRPAPDVLRDPHGAGVRGVRGRARGRDGPGGRDRRPRTPPPWRTPRSPRSRRRPGPHGHSRRHRGGHRPRKAGIVKPDGFLVSSAQQPGAAQASLERAQELGSSFRFEGVEFSVTAQPPPWQVITVQGLAGEYPDGDAPASAPTRRRTRRSRYRRGGALLGGGEKPLNPELVSEGLGAAYSPGRLRARAQGSPWS